ncbi:MAG: hypothetical protein ACRCWB_05505 [Enterovibrio sp.]
MLDPLLAEQEEGERLLQWELLRHLVAALLSVVLAEQQVVQAMVVNGEV